MEVLGRERRRTWTAEQKRAIVAESLGSELTPTRSRANTRSAVACCIRGASKSWEARSALSLDPRPVLRGWSLALRLRHRTVVNRVLPEVPAPRPPSRPDGVIEVVLPSGVLVRVDAAVDGRALRRVLSALDDR